jgi:hypothetical protein
MNKKGGIIPVLGMADNPSSKELVEYEKSGKRRTMKKKSLKRKKSLKKNKSQMKRK